MLLMSRAKSPITLSAGDLDKSYEAQVRGKRSAVTLLGEACDHDFSLADERSHNIVVCWGAIVLRLTVEFRPVR